MAQSDLHDHDRNAPRWRNGGATPLATAQDSGSADGPAGRIGGPRSLALSWSTNRANTIAEHGRHPSGRSGFDTYPDRALSSLLTRPRRQPMSQRLAGKSHRGMRKWWLTRG